MDVALRPMASRDLDQLHVWLNRPHVLEWWHDHPTRADVEEHYGPRLIGGSTVHMLVAEVGGRPVGWLAWYRLGDEPDYAPGLDLPDDAVAADLAIGDPDLLGRGLGRTMLGTWLGDVVAPLAPPAPAAFIDPDPMNGRAVECYRALGFEPTGPLLPDPHHPDGLRLLMRLDLGAPG